MIPYLWVALGSALGGTARYGLGLTAARLWGESFPWGTIAINIIGSFVIGFFGALTAPDGVMPASPSLRTFVMVGICGGFTTFSSFSLQTLSLARDGSWFPAMGNVVLSVALCLAAVTLGQVSAERIGVLQAEAAPTPPGILAILDRADTAMPVLQAAELAAGRFGTTQMEALHLRHHGLEGFMPTEDVITRSRQQEIDGAAARKSTEMRALFDSWRLRSGIGTWRELAGETERVLAAEAGGASLVVVGHGIGWRHGDAKRAIHVALFDARAATLMVPATESEEIGRRVAIAWKPGEAADRAVTASLPLLRRAEQVNVLVTTEDGGLAPEPVDLLGRLAQAGIAATLHRFDPGGRPIGTALIAEAHKLGADLLVMGAYSHSRLTEFVIGGATSEVLASADLPVFMHH
jgi:protein CrcB